MYRFLNKKKGQSTLEYAILIIIIIGALLSIQVYIKRGVQGRLKQATDDIGDQFSVGNTNVKKTRFTNSKTSDTFLSGVQESKIIDRNEETRETLSANIINVETEFWGKQ